MRGHSRPGLSGPHSGACVIRVASEVGMVGIMTAGMAGTTRFAATPTGAVADACPIAGATAAGVIYVRPVSQLDSDGADQRVSAQDVGQIPVAIGAAGTTLCTASGATAHRTARAVAGTRAGNVGDAADGTVRIRLFAVGMITRDVIGPRLRDSRRAGPRLPSRLVGGVLCHRPRLGDIRVPGGPGRRGALGGFGQAAGRTALVRF